MTKRFDRLIADLDMTGTRGFQLVSAISPLSKNCGRPQIIVRSGLLHGRRANRRQQLRLAAGA